MMLLLLAAEPSWISGAVFDSAAFDTNAFSIDSWDFGEEEAADPVLDFSHELTIKNNEIIVIAICDELF
jgi:hypothetical protein